MRNPKKKGASAKKKGGAKPVAAKAVDMETEAAEKPQVWQPGDPIEEGEELEYDRSSYQCFHQLGFEWPCLSFDLMSDNLGDNRKSFPLTQYMVAGTQAPMARGQVLAIARLARMGQGGHGDKAKKEEASEDEDEMSDSDDDDDNGEEPPLMAFRQLAHPGCVWDVAPQLAEIEEEAQAPGMSKKKPAIYKVQPRETFRGHAMEGYAVDWSPCAPGVMATGDCSGSIHLWEPRTDGSAWAVDKAPCKSHDGSVEDIQWSPTEPSVLISSSVDRHIFVWDKRQRTEPMMRVMAHEADVNVISWNHATSYMLASGGDDGTLRIWDLRNFKPADFVAHFKHHKAAVTSVEWCPHESSMLATTSADNQTIVWDLALERDPEEEAAMAADMEAMGSSAAAPADIPPQLLFVHAGQSNVKELHWHPQIPGLITTTAEDGFHVFKPSNLGM